MTAPETYSDAYMVRMVERILATSDNDHMIGNRVRVLFELRELDVVRRRTATAQDEYPDGDAHDPRD